MRKLGVICGFKAEVECFHRAAKATGITSDRYIVLPSGSSSKRAGEIADYLVSGGANFLLSFGIAGGLDPKFPVGDVVFSTHIVTEDDEAFGMRPAAQKSLSLRSGTLNRQASVAGVNNILLTPDDKARVYQITKAAIADMESHAVARVAKEHSLPFFVLRSVSDGARDSLPPFVSDAVDAEGNPKLAHVLSALMKNPFMLGSLLKLKTNTDKAVKSLEEATMQLLPHLFRD